MPSAKRQDYQVHPATADRFDDVALVLGPKRPDANVCWCLSHRIDSRTNRELVGTARADFVRELCARPVSPGVLAYERDGTGEEGREGERVVGWAAVAPRGELPVARSTKIPWVDDRPVWSVICLRVRPGHRGKGVSHALLDGAVRYAASQGAPVVEGYPVDNQGRKVDLTMAFVGTRKLFEDAGFTWAADTTAVAGGFPRVVMRRELSPQ